MFRTGSASRCWRAPSSTYGFIIAALTAVIVSTTGSLDVASATTAENHVGLDTARMLARPHGRPNIIMFLTDDMNADELRYLPAVKRLLVRRGVTFTRALAPNSLCCPARATLMTGMYSHNHHVTGNEGEEHGGWGAFSNLDQHNLLPTWLQRSGYRTWHVGKHLNGFKSVTSQPGWDYWNATVHGIYNYRHFATAVQGRLVRHVHAYQERVVRAQLLRGISRWAPSRQPFFMWVGSLAPHGEVGSLPEPEARYRGKFSGHAFPTSPAFREKNISDKGPWVRLEPNGLTAAKAQLSEEARVEALQSVDDTVAAAARRLRATGDFGRTVFLFLSDNGFLLGEHRHHGKNVPYEEAIRIPLVIAGPGFAPHTRVGALVSHADVTATILDIANARSGLTADGRSLRDKGRTSRLGPRRVIPIEGGTFQIPRRYADQQDRLGRFYWGARWSHYVFVEYEPGFREFYNLRTDPYELDNAYRPGAHAGAVQRALVRWVHHRKNCVGKACNQPLHIRR